MIWNSRDLRTLRRFEVPAQIPNCKWTLPSFLPEEASKGARACQAKNPGLRERLCQEGHPSANGKAKESQDPSLAHQVSRGRPLDRQEKTLLSQGEEAAASA